MKKIILLPFILWIFGSSVGFYTPSGKNAKLCKLGDVPPERSSHCCGVDSVAVKKVVGGNLTHIRQHPWLGLVEYKMFGMRGVVTQCGAFLISGRYVVTAAHCVSGEVLQHGTPVSVRLGEYDKSKPGKDCVTYPEGRDCTDGPISVEIEDVIVHERYNDANVRNDIALLRLRRTVTYTDFIRPICLPEYDVTTNPPRNLYLVSAGWGIYDHMEGDFGEMVNIASDVKRDVELPYRKYSDCKRRWGSLFSKSQICAGGEEGKDSCMGDSGGPLMYFNEGVYEAVGIVSFGAGAPCGQRGVYGVYTKVYEYLDWIRGHIGY